MGAEQSKQDDQERRRENQKKSSQDYKKKSMGSGTALAVGAAVGITLLGVALAITSSASDDNRVDQTRNQTYILESRRRKGQPSKSSTSNKAISGPKTSLKIMSYNVWSQEKCKLTTRMEAIGKLVEAHSPHFICFQEITPLIYNHFSKSSWWEHYHCSMSVDEANNKQYFCILLSRFIPVNIIKAPLGYSSKVGREISIMETKVWGNKSLVVATGHLKSRYADPSVLNGQCQNKKERISQAKDALIILKKYPNVIFCGDMNWDENVDGEFPLPDGWVDAWIELKPNQRGFTYDTRTNAMLSGHPRQMRKRFDRGLCNLNSFELEEIEMIGKDPIPDVTHQSNPVLPSDHYGLILTIS